MKAKKLISMFLAMLMLFNLTACGGGGNNEVTLKWPTNITYGAATVGIPYTIQKFLAEDTSGAKYTPTIEIENNDLGTMTDYDGEADTYTFTTAGSYTIRYAVTFLGASVKKEFPVTVSESLTGNKASAISAIEQAANAKIGQPTKYSKEKRDALAALITEYTDLIEEATTQAALDTAKTNGLSAINAIGESGAPIINGRKLESEGGSQAEAEADAEAYNITDITNGFKAVITGGRKYSSIRYSVSDFTNNYTKLSMTVKNLETSSLIVTVRVTNTENSGNAINGSYGQHFTIVSGRTTTIQTDFTTVEPAPKSIFIYLGTHEGDTPARVEAEVTNIEFIKMDGLHVGQLTSSSGSSAYFDVDNARINYSFPIGFNDLYKSVEWPVTNFNLGTFNYAKITVANFGSSDIQIQTKHVDASNTEAQANYGSAEIVYANGGESYIYASELCKITDGVKKPEQLVKIQMFIRPATDGAVSATTSAVAGYLTVDIELLEEWPARVETILGNTKIAPTFNVMEKNTAKDLSYSFKTYDWTEYESGKYRYEEGTPIPATLSVENSGGTAVTTGLSGNTFTPATADTYTITYTATYNSKSLECSTTLVVVDDLLAYTKTNAINELTAFLAELKAKNDYSSSEEAELNLILSEATDEINAVELADIADIATIVADAKADMEALNPIPVITTNGIMFNYGDYINGMDAKITVSDVGTGKNYKSTDDVNQNAGYVKYNQTGANWGVAVTANQVTVVVKNNINAQRYLRIAIMGPSDTKLNGNYGVEYAIGANEAKVIIANVTVADADKISAVHFHFGGTGNGGDPAVAVDFTIYQVAVAQTITKTINGGDISLDDDTGLYNISFEAKGGYNNYYQGIKISYESFEYLNTYNFGSLCLELDLTDSDNDIQVQYKFKYDVYKNGVWTEGTDSNAIYRGFYELKGGYKHYLDAMLWTGINFDGGKDNLRNVTIEVQFRPTGLTDNTLATAYDVDFGINFVVGNPSDINQDYQEVRFSTEEVETWKAGLDTAFAGSFTAGTQIAVAGALTLGGKTASVAVTVKDSGGADVTVTDGYKFTPATAGDYTVTYTATYHNHVFIWTDTITVA